MAQSRAAKTCIAAAYPSKKISPWALTLEDHGWRRSSRGEGGPTATRGHRQNQPQPPRYCRPFRRGYFRHTIHSGQSTAETAVRRPSLAQGRLRSFWAHRLVSRQESRSLSELTRQITPPTKNGHAPPPTESRKSYQSVNPSSVRAWWDFPCWVKLSHRLHSWWCPSVNSFKSLLPFYRLAPNLGQVSTSGNLVSMTQFWCEGGRNGFRRCFWGQAASAEKNLGLAPTQPCWAKNPNSNFRGPRSGPLLLWRPRNQDLRWQIFEVMIFVENNH